MTEPMLAVHHTCCVARPGDVLIVGLASATSADNVRQIANGLKAGLPDTVKICVLDNVSAIQVVRDGGN